MPADDVAKWERRSPDSVRAWLQIAQHGDYWLPAGECRVFRLGLAMAIEPDHACYFWDRSSMGAVKNLHRLAGVIDEDYRGEWLVCLTNLGQVPQRITCDDPIVQGVYQERIEATYKQVAVLPAAGRGLSGFGEASTGKNEGIVE
jgi:dUTPase